MTTKLFARGIGSALAFASALGIVGCAGYDGQQGAAGEGEIGSVEQNIVKANIVADAALQGAHASGISCLITDPTGPGAGTPPKSYLLVAGGETASGTFSHTAEIFDGTSWSVAATDNTLINFKLAAAIVDPLHADTCIALGGENGGGKLDTIVSFVIDHNGGGNPVLAVAQAGKLSVARSRLAVVPCDTKVLAIGGSAAAASPVLDVWDPSFMAGNTAIPVLVNTNGTPRTSVLNTARFDLAAVVRADVSGSKDGVVITGGNTGLGKLSDVEIIRTDGSCNFDDSSAPTPPATTVKVTSLTAAAATVRLGAAGGAAPRSQLAGFQESSVSVFVAGDTGLGASAREDRITVDWTTFSSSTAATSATELDTAVKNPFLVPFINGRYFLVGGDGVAAIQEYDPSATPAANVWTSETLRSNNSGLPNRNGAVGGTLGSSAYVGGGFTTAGGTYHTLMEKLY